MDTTMTAKEISEEWLRYVTETFLLRDGCVRPEVEAEYRRLESTDSFTMDRELWRSYTDTLIQKILDASPESRQQLYSDTDHRSLAYVQDRVQCGTELLIALVQKDLQVNTGGIASLEDFFRQILLQKPED
jgi:hypothetical protein